MTVFKNTLLIKFFILLLLSNVTIIAFGQVTEKFYNYSWQECKPDVAAFYSSITKTDSGFVVKDYFIQGKSLQMSGKFADSAAKVKHGFFYFFHQNGKIESFGKCENNLKEGLWLSYYQNGMMMDSSFYLNDKRIGTRLAWHRNGILMDSTVVNADGTGINFKWFDNGYLSSAGYITNFDVPDGIWKFYHNNGQLSARETYQEGEIIDKQYFDENGEPVADTANKDKDAEFPGGLNGWNKFIVDNLYHPDGYTIVNSDKATVIISFVVNEMGKVEDVEVFYPFFEAFDAIAIKGILKSPTWKPAIKNNRRVKSFRRQPISFVVVEKRR